MRCAPLALALIACPPAAPADTTESSSETSSSSSEQATDTTTSIATVEPTSSTTESSTTESSTTEETSATSTSISTGETLLCGNGIQDPDEECDDGNLLDADLCTASCTLAVCGDGIVQLGVEGCDDGNDDDTDDCPSTCAVAGCGDGFVWAGHEQCDDANFIPGDGCEADCEATPPMCGNGLIESGEECDDMNLDENDGCESICNAYAFWSGVEMDVPEDSLEGWTLCFDNKVTAGQFPKARLDCLDKPQHTWILIGCEHHERVDGVLELAAMGVRSEVMQGNQPGAPREVNGLWWSLVNNQYFGFAPIGVDPYVGFDSPQFDWSSSSSGACGPGGLDQPARRVVYVR